MSNKPHISAAKFSKLRKIFSQAGTDPAAFAHIRELPNPDPILRRAGKSTEVYQQIATDAHVIGELRTLRAGMLAFNTELIPGGDDAASIQSYELAKSLFKRKPAVHTEWADIDWHAYSAILHGFSVTHLGAFKKDDGRWMPTSIESWKTSRFCFDNDHQLLLKTRENPNGEEIDPRRWACVRHMPTPNNAYGSALFSSCFWPWTFKHGGFKFFVQLCERFGVPFPIGKHPAQAQDKDIDQLLEGMAMLVRDGIAAIPDDSSIEILESKLSGDPVQLQLIKLCNAEMSKAITSQTLATEQSGQGARAASETHAKRAGENQRADRSLVANTRNQILTTLHQVNFDGGEPPRFLFQDKKEVNTDTVSRVRETAKTVPVSKEWAYKELQVPQPKEGEELLEIAGDAPGVASTAKTDFAQGGEGDDIPQWDDFDQATSDQVAKIWQFAQSADSLKDLKTRILNSFPTITDSALADVMSRALQLDYLEGMIDADQ